VSRVPEAWVRRDVPTGDQQWWSSIAADLTLETDLPWEVRASIVAGEWEAVAELDGDRLRLAVDGYGRTLRARIAYYGQADYIRYNGAVPGPSATLHEGAPGVARSEILDWVCEACNLVRMLEAGRRARS